MLRDVFERVTGLQVVSRARMASEAAWSPSRDCAAHATALAGALEKAYGATAVPLFRGTLAQAKAEALSRRALLVAVIVPAEEHPLRDAFCRAVFASDEVARVLTSERAVVWAADAALPFARGAAEALRISDLPAVACLAPRHGRATQWLVLSRTTGGVPEPAGLSAHIAGLLAGVVAVDASRREQRAAAGADQRLRDEQDAAYERSLRADAERRRQREAEAAAMRAQEEADRARREKRLSLAAELESRLDDSVHGTDGADVRLSLQLPGGGRVQRVFSSAAPCSNVYAWAFVACASEDAADAWLSAPGDLAVRLPLGGSVLPDADVSLRDAGIAVATKLIAEQRRPE